MINTETNYRWFIFYQDQLLLEKNDNAFSIPTGKNAPVTTPEGITVHTITTTTGMVCKAFYTDSPIAETPEYVQIGLRASYDYLSPEHYQAAGKVHEILYWDRSNRFCPTCGTPLVQKTHYEEMPELWQRNLSGHLNSHPGIGAQRRLPVIGTCPQL
jgi:putative NAD(+) diphosphatase